MAQKKAEICCHCGLGGYLRGRNPVTLDHASNDAQPDPNLEGFITFPVNPANKSVTPKNVSSTGSFPNPAQFPASLLPPRMAKNPNPSVSLSPRFCSESPNWGRDPVTLDHASNGAQRHLQKNQDDPNIEGFIKISVNQANQSVTPEIVPSTGSFSNPTQFPVTLLPSPMEKNPNPSVSLSPRFCSEAPDYVQFPESLLTSPAMNTNPSSTVSRSPLCVSGAPNSDQFTSPMATNPSMRLSSLRGFGTPNFSQGPLLPSPVTMNPNPSVSPSPLFGSVLNLGEDFNTLIQNLKNVKTWWEAVVFPEDPGSIKGIKENANDKTKTDEDEEEVSIEKLGNYIRMFLKCPCCRTYQILLSEQDCYYKLM